MSEVDDSDYSLLLICDSYHLSTYMYTTIPQSTALKKRVAMTLAWIKLAAGSLRGKSNVQKRGVPVVASASKGKFLFGATLSQQVCRVLHEAGGNVAGDRDPTAVPDSRGSLQSPEVCKRTPRPKDTGQSTASKVNQPPKKCPSVPAADPDVVGLLEEVIINMPAESAKAITGAGHDDAAAKRVTKKHAPILLEQYSKLKAVTSVKAKWWDLTAKAVNKALGVEIMPLSKNSHRHFAALKDIFKRHVTAVQCIDDRSVSVSLHGAIGLGDKSGSSHFWGRTVKGLDIQEQEAAPGQRRRDVGLGVTLDSAQLNRVIAKHSHQLTSGQADVLSMRGTPRVLNTIPLFLMNQPDGEDQIEMHAGNEKAFVKHTGKTVGGDLQVPLVQVSFKHPFEGSTTEKVRRSWTAGASLDWLRVNGFIRGNLVMADADEPLPDPISTVLLEHDRIWHQILGRAMRASYYGDHAAGGLKVEPEDENEVSWDPVVVSNMIEGGRWITSGVLSALMSTAHEAFTDMVTPLVVKALESAFNNDEQVERLVTIDTGGLLSSLTVEIKISDILRTVIIADCGDFLLGDVLLNDAVESKVDVSRVLDDKGLENLRLCIADANRPPISSSKVIATLLDVWQHSRFLA